MCISCQLLLCCLDAEEKQHLQQELEGRRQDLIAKERSLDQAEAAAERRWAKLTEDVSAKVLQEQHLCTGVLLTHGLVKSESAAVSVAMISGVVGRTSEGLYGVYHCTGDTPMGSQCLFQIKGLPKVLPWTSLTCTYVLHGLGRTAETTSTRHDVGQDMPVGRDTTEQGFALLRKARAEHTVHSMVVRVVHRAKKICASP